MFSHTFLLNQLWKIQHEEGYLSDKAIRLLSRQTGRSWVDLEGVISFYHFFRRKPAGRFLIFLNNSILSEFAGFPEVLKAFQESTGAHLNQTDPTDTFTLQMASCIGLSDVEPAALINWRPFINLTPEKVHHLIHQLKSGTDIDDLADRPLSDAYPNDEENKRLMIRPYQEGMAISKLIRMSPDEVIKEIMEAGLTGLGGAFFPTHLKWQSCRNQADPEKYIVCNADEGEPGTFKDRFLILKYPGLLLEGMITAGFAVGARQGVIYLRGEYQYLIPKIKDAIRHFKNEGWLGNDACGIPGFDFDIDLVIGAGAYICGEETALLESLEGHRGEPRPRVHYPTERGYLGKPTVVNNVETLCTAARILEQGFEPYLNTRHPDSPGTKLFSIAGDCLYPGIYEITWGITVGALLERCGAVDPYAIQISGPSGELIPASWKDRMLGLHDLRCGGSVMIYNRQRDLLQILQNYNRFFMQESCGVCTPCRAGNYMLSVQLRKMERGLASTEDVDKLNDWAKLMEYNSRCGLGQTAPKAIIQAAQRFPEIMDQHTRTKNAPFDLDLATSAYDRIINELR